MDRGAWQATVPGVTKSQTQLSTHTVSEKDLSTRISQHQFLPDWKRRTFGMEAGNKVF